jgi:hypothetical protein
MGPGAGATPAEVATAFALGQQIAQQGWVLLTGGRAAGVMDAASRGAQAAGGLVIGILPGETTAQMSSSVDIPILTGVGQGRNVINVLSSQVVIACGLGAGTLSEMALALKLQKPLILMHVPTSLQGQLTALATAPVYAAATVTAAIAQAQHYLSP